MTVFDLIGLVGVSFIVVAYILLQADKLSSSNPWFSVVNAIGSGLVLVSLWFEFNLSAAVVEGFWLIVSLFGLWRSRRGRNASGQKQEE
jgi:hypothetical protein